MMQTLTTIQTIAVWIIPVGLAITLHEAAHAWVASLCGDNTARALGRLSINPLKHVDPVGTLLVPLLIGVFSGFQFIFGWAKPVPISWHQLHHPRRDMAFVAAAGPIANLFMVLFWALCSKVGLLFGPQSSVTALFMMLMGEAGILINLVLAFLNLIPIPPLDGSRVIASLLPPRLALRYLATERFGLLVVLVLLLTGALGWFITTPMAWSLHIIRQCFGL